MNAKVIHALMRIAALSAVLIGVSTAVGPSLGVAAVAAVWLIMPTE